MQSKRCTKCRDVKPVSSFVRDCSRRDGLTLQCKKCFRAYREAHREEYRAYSRAYREAHRDEISDSQRAYREAHREEIGAYQRAYHEAHRDEVLARMRKRHAETLGAAREVATRNGEPWTPAEDHVVLTSEGTTLEMAIELGRTTKSVEARLSRLRRKAVTA